MRELVLHEADQLRRWRIYFRGSIKHGESLQQARSVEERQSDCLHIAQSSTVIITVEDFWIMLLQAVVLQALAQLPHTIS